jgi:hypothetical protein
MGKQPPQHSLTCVAAVACGVAVCEQRAHHWLGEGVAGAIISTAQATCGARLAAVVPQADGR